MYLSLNWLKKYVNLEGLTPEEIGLKLTMATAEVEEVVPVKYNFDNIFLCEIISAEPNAEDSKLKNVIVSVGPNKEYKTVCGAPNVKTGMISVFALPGAIVDGKKLKAKESFKGFASQGILLSVAELGMNESHVEIIETHESEQSGTPLKDVFPETDYLIEIDNKSLTHRPDLWGHYGFARELAAIYGRELRPLLLDDLDKYIDLPKPKVKILDYENCPRYSCLYIDNLPDIKSPMWMQYDLLQAGVRPINLPVDLTNYISLEIGQPMHAFDGDKVDFIKIGQMNKKGTFITLDDSERKMLAEDLMIYDNDTPIAIAGIMGGQNTEVSESTTKITLESANFYASRIRKTSTRLGLRTDASQRYEKSQPHANTVLGIKRYVFLAKSVHKPLAVTSSLFDDKKKDLAETTDIKVDKKYMLERIGAEIPIKTINGILTSLGFGVNDEGDFINVKVPEFRSLKDISIPEDIIEEAARVYGYDNIEMQLPSIKISRYNWNAQRTLEHKIKKFLSITCGLSEVQSYAWFDSDWCNEIGFKIPDAALTLLNYVSESQSRLRTTLIPNILKMTDNNSAFYEKFGIYEMGKVYEQDKKKVNECMKLVVSLSNREKSSSILFSELKGIINSLFLYLFNAEPEFIENTQKGMQTGYKVRLGKHEAGWFGIPDDNYLKSFRKGVRVAFAEFNIEKMAEISKREIKLVEPPRFPGSWLDFSIVSKSDYSGIIEILDKYKNEVVVKRDFIMVYEGKGLEKNEKSYSFRYAINYKDHTPSGEEIQAFKDDFVAFLNKNGLHLR